MRSASGVRPAITRVTSLLPKPRTRLIGRDADLAELLARIRGHARCVTLLGPPGVGKTRLAVGAANALADECHVVWIDLAAANSARETELAIAGALRAPSHASLWDAIEAVLASLGETLLVLDNCEEVSVALALAIDRLLQRHEGVRVLCTSRVALRLSYEAQVPVRPLARSTSARELFHERLAGRRGPLREAELAHVDRIVAALDGIPLALELAASRSGVFSLAELADKLEHDTSVLADPAPDRDARHRRYDAAIAATFGMLDPSLRAALSRLALFRASFERASAEAIAGECAVEALEELRLASLVERVESPRGPRFRMYECLRRQAAAELDAEARAEAERRMAEHLATEGARLADWNVSLDEDRAQHLVDDLANYRIAWTRMRSDPTAADLAVTLGCVLASIYLARGPLKEARAVLDDTLTDEIVRRASPALAGDAYRKRGHVRAVLGDDGAEADLTRALELVAEPGRGPVLRALAALHTRLGRPDAALGLAERAFARGERAGDLAEQTLSLFEIAAAERAAVRHDRALTSIERAIQIDERAFGPTRPAMYHALRGDILQELGRYDDADRAYGVAVDAVRARGLTAYLAKFTAARALARWEAGDFALPLLDDALVLLARSDDAAWLVACKVARAVIARDAELLEAAAREAERLDGDLARNARAIAALGRAIADPRSEPTAGAVAATDARVRLFQRMLARAVHTGTSARRLAVHRGGQFVCWNGATLDLSRRPLLARLVFVLAQARLVAPERGLAAAEIFSAAWPEERIRERAARNRLRVAVAELRKLGLRDLIETTVSGYVLARDAHVEMIEPERASRARG